MALRATQDKHARIAMSLLLGDWYCG